MHTALHGISSHSESNFQQRSTRPCLIWSLVTSTMSSSIILPMFQPHWPPCYSSNPRHILVSCSTLAISPAPDTLLPNSWMTHYSTFNHTPHAPCPFPALVFSIALITVDTLDVLLPFILLSVTGPHTIITISFLKAKMSVLFHMVIPNSWNTVWTCKHSIFSWMNPINENFKHSNGCAKGRGKVQNYFKKGSYIISSPINTMLCVCSYMITKAAS